MTQSIWPVNWVVDAKSCLHIGNLVADPLTGTVHEVGVAEPVYSKEQATNLPSLPSGLGQSTTYHYFGLSALQFAASYACGVITVQQINAARHYPQARLTIVQAQLSTLDRPPFWIFLVQSDREGLGFQRLSREEVARATS